MHLDDAPSMTHCLVRVEDPKPLSQNIADAEIKLHYCLFIFLLQDKRRVLLVEFYELVRLARRADLALEQKHVHPGCDGVGLYWDNGVRRHRHVVAEPLAGGYGVQRPRRGTLLLHECQRYQKNVQVNCSSLYSGKNVHAYTIGCYRGCTL